MMNNRSSWSQKAMLGPFFVETPNYNEVDFIRSVAHGGQSRRPLHYNNHFTRGTHNTTKVQSFDDGLDIGQYGGSDNKSIYYMLKPVLFICKYIGIFPLDGVYESTTFMNGYWRRIIFNYLIPFVANVWLCFIGYVIMMVLANSDPLLTRRGVDYYSVLVVNVLNVTLNVLPPMVAFFRNARMVKYLKMFARVDDILIRRKSTVRRRIIIIYSIMILTQLCKSHFWMYLIGKLDPPDFVGRDTNVFGAFTPLVKPLYVTGMMIGTFSEIYTQAIYFAIVHAMGSGFLTIKEMLKEIDMRYYNEETKEKSNDIHALFKLRELRLKHVHLVQMGRRLDRLFSPILFLTFVIGAMTTSVVLFQLINTKNHAQWTYTLCVYFYGKSQFLAMMIVCTYADRTIKAGNSISPTIFSSGMTANPACREEINLFALQLNVHQVNFTASGFFTINHSLAGTILGIAITYSVVMVQLRGVDSV